MNPAAPSRVRSVDCAKCLAIFCVLLIHAASDVLRGGPISSIRWLSGLFWGSVSRGAVPLFLLCSGALLLDAERTTSARHIWRRNIPHMLLALFFWAAVYKAIGLLTAGQTDAAALRGAVRDWLLWQHEGHLYYLPVILLVYAALPLTRTFTAHADAKTMRYFLAFWFAFGVLLPTLRQLGLLQDFGGIVRQWPLPMVWSAIGCTVLGDALRRRPLTARCAGLLFARLFALLCGDVAALCESWGTENAVSGGLLARPMPDGRRAVLPLHGQPQRLHRPVERLSRASFCIYLVHIAVLRLLGALGLHANRFAMLSILAVAVLCGAISYFIYLPLSKLPWIKRWLI